MKHTFILLLGAMLSLQGQAQDKQMQFQNTIKVEAGDSHADIIAKAAHVVPSPYRRQRQMCIRDRPA